MLWFMLVGYLHVTTSTNALNHDKPSSWVVQIAQGCVRGYRAPDSDLYVFYSLPYATAPTGIHKFKGPLPPPSWSELLDAVDRHIVCPQVNLGMVPKDVVMQEDCLTANVYVPITKKKNLPVVVYVHGGAYLIGYGDISTPKNLVNSQKVIAVTFNYRLGAQGFLCMGTPDIPGNAGMKDQVALLHWVKNNIKHFGGNPDDVTIAGYSAGSSAVDLLMISKLANGLFNKVIPESGANLAAFSVQSDPLENAKIYALLLNFTSVNDIQALEEFYKRAPYELLTSVVHEVSSRPDSTFLFSPCVERDTGTEMFLHDAPVNILKNGNYQKLPMLYGFSNMEGLFRIELFEDWKEKMNQRFEDFLPADLIFKSKEEKEKVAKKAKYFYFGTKYVGEETILDFIDYFTDVIFAYPTLRSVKMQVEAGNNNVFLYVYSFVDDNTPYVPYTNVRGADHCSQTSAIQDGVNMTHSDESIISEEYKQMKNKMRQLWLNFISIGIPVPDVSPKLSWFPVKAEGAPYMSLNQTSELQFTPMLQERVVFWDSIYDKHYRFPQRPDPYSKVTLKLKKAFT